MDKNMARDDGKPLNSISHPKASLWKRIGLFFKFPKIRETSLETIEMELRAHDH